MQLREHAAKLSWTALDKLLFIFYGGITLLQIRALGDPAEYGLASQLLTLQTWIFIICDGSVLQAVIQFGVERKDQPRTNTIALALHTAISLGISLGILLFEPIFTSLFKEPRFEVVATTLPLYCLLTIPRAFCLKILQRDLMMRETFLTNLAWFGTMGGMSLWMMSNGTLRTYNDMVTIALAGVSMSSVFAVLLTWKNLRFSTEGTVALRAVLRFASPQALMVALSNSIRQLDILLVQVYFGLPASGVYNSAKMFYRVFETATDAGIALMYPAAVRLLAQKRESSIITIFSKAISFILLPTIGAVVVLELGATNVLVALLGEKFRAAAPQFNVMILGALFLPFFILQSVELAQHYVGKLLRHVVISMICGLVTFYVLGKMQLATWFPLGIVVYSASFAVQLVLSVRSELHFPLTDIFRAIPDALSFVRDLRTVSDK